jgi:tetratricopeptide (TPR) repeat protein
MVYPYVKHSRSRKSGFDQGEETFRESFLLYQELSDRRRIACCKGLGNLAVGQSQHDKAIERLQEASSLDEKVRDREAWQTLGTVSLYRSNVDEAEARFTKVIVLNDEVCDKRGNARRIRNPGDVALVRSKFVRCPDRNNSLVSSSGQAVFRPESNKCPLWKDSLSFHRIGFFRKDRLSFDCQSSSEGSDTNFMTSAVELLKDSLSFRRSGKAESGCAQLLQSRGKQREVVTKIA